jgi:hypothetical protein
MLEQKDADQVILDSMKLEHGHSTQNSKHVLEIIKCWCDTGQTSMKKNPWLCEPFM